MVIPEEAMPPIMMIDQLDKSQKAIFIEDGSQLYGQMIQERFGYKAVFSSPYYNFPRTSIVASLALNRLIRKQYDSVEALVPKYLHLSDAEINWAKKHGHQAIYH